MLIIGESHYGNQGPEKSKEFFNDKTKTRGLHEEIAIDGISYGTKIFQNLYKTLFPNRLLNREVKEKFWQLTSYYNFIQRPMIQDLERNDNYIEKPKRQDFRNGWQIFFELYPVLKPSICLFIGTSSADFFNGQVNKFPNFKANQIEWHEEKINGAYPKFTKLNLGESESSLYFIKHTSSRFSPNPWNEHLHNKIGPQIKWLENRIG